MKNILIFIIVLFASCTKTYAQDCPTFGVRLESYSEMVDFTNQYPNCTVLESFLEIGSPSAAGSDNPNILSMSPLTQIEEIKGNLRINAYTNLTDFRGLENLRKIGGDLHIRDGFRLESFVGLESLDTIMGDLFVKSRDIASLQTLTGLKYIGGDIIIEQIAIVDLDIPNLEHVGGLILTNCNYLIDLNGFDNITEIDNILIEDSQNLNIISGFGALTTITGKFEIIGSHDVSEIGSFSTLDSIGTLKFNRPSPEFPSFPNLTEVGDLIFFETRFNNLTEQPNLDTIHNNFEIKDTEFVTNVDWGQNIKAIKGGIIVTGNRDLVALEGLENVPELNDLVITQNVSFSTLEGFNNHTSLRNVTIDRYVKNILGLQPLQELENLDLEISTLIESIVGFQNLTVIHNNALISSQSVNIDGLFPSLISVGNDLTLVDFTEISNFSGVQTVGNKITFDNCVLQDFSALENLNPVREIAIQSCEVDSYINLPSFANDSTGLTIYETDGSLNLEGLEPITALRYLSLDENGLLESVNGLSNVTAIHEGIMMGDNSRLKSLAPMTELRTIGNLNLYQSRIDTLPNGILSISGKINIRFSFIDSINELESVRHLGDGILLENNGSIRTLDGLINLETFEGTISIINNSVLRDISGLNSISDPNHIDYLEIRGNERLSDCNIDLFCEYLQLQDKESKIFGNDGTCTDDNIYCPQYSISGFFFYDQNENGIKDENERGLTYGRAYDEERGQTNSTNEDGRYHFYTFIDSAYTIDYGLIFGTNMEDNWRPTTDSSLTITFSQGDPMNSSYNFGFAPTYVSNQCNGFDEFSFDAQRKIDDFPYEFPWCNVISEDLIIREKYYGGIIDLMGFEQLGSIDGNLDIIGNPQLTSLAGLHNIQSVSDELNITYLSRLKNLSGLDQLREVNDKVVILDNRSLKDIYGIANLDHTKVSELTIFNNDSLGLCDVPFVCKYIGANINPYTIGANLPECHEDELGGCLDHFFGGTVFYDNNGDKIQGENDYGVAQFPVKVNGNILLGTQLGRYFVFGETGELYNVEIDLAPELRLTTDSITYTEIYEMGTLGLDHDFGIQYLEEIKRVSLNISSGAPRCFEIVDFQPRITNEGSAIIDARIELTLDPRTELVSYLIEPSGFDTLSNIYWWETDTLYTFQTLTQSLKVRIPDFNSLGDTLNFQLSLYEGINEEALSTYDYTSVVRCSYDPNDKLVYPMGQGEDNYTLFNDSLLTYTIRFQNTGNDYAKNIRITDTLSTLLDWETFKVVNSNFPLLTSINGPYVEFLFTDIYLPDSTSNEPGSHGFVTYEIETLPNLDENELIENTAHIYFDFNPPIVTNTVQNTMVSEYPITFTTEEELEIDVRIIPNPTDGMFRVENDSKYRINEIRIYNQQGVLMSQYSGREEFDIHHLTSGFYVIKVIFDNNIISSMILKM